MTVTARYIESLKEVRLYHDDGHYWPLKFTEPEEAESFVRFVNETIDRVWEEYIDVRQM